MISITSIDGSTRRAGADGVLRFDPNTESTATAMLRVLHERLAILEETEASARKYADEVEQTIAETRARHEAELAPLLTARKNYTEESRQALAEQKEVFVEIHHCEMAQRFGRGQ